MKEEAKANQKKWNKSEEYFQKEFPDHEDGCLYGKIVVKAAYTAGRDSRDEYLKKLLKSNIDQHNKIGFLSRKVYALERQIEKMKCCEMCKHKNLNWGFSPICEARDKIKIENPLTCKCDKWEIKEK